MDFDKTKHLAESTMKKRKIEREKLVEKEREKGESERRHKEIEEMYFTRMCIFGCLDA